MDHLHPKTASTHSATSDTSLTPDFVPRAADSFTKVTLLSIKCPLDCRTCALKDDSIDQTTQTHSNWRRHESCEEGRVDYGSRDGHRGRCRTRIPRSGLLRGPQRSPRGSL